MVAAVGRDVAFVARQPLFMADTPARGCWLIRHGRVGIETEVAGRGAVALQTLGPGDVAGLSWLLAPYRWRFSAVALTAVTATSLDTDRLRAAARENPEFGYALSRQMLSIAAQRLHHTRARLLDVYRNPDER